MKYLENTFLETITSPFYGRIPKAKMITSFFVSKNDYVGVLMWSKSDKSDYVQNLISFVRLAKANMCGKNDYVRT